MQRHSVFRPLRSSGVFAVLLMVCAAAPLSAAPLSKWMPKDTLVYVEWAGAETMGEDFDGSHLQGLLRDTNLDENVIKLFDLWMGEMARGGDEAEIAPRAQRVAQLMWERPWAISFRGVTFPAGGGEPTIHLSMIMKTGDKADAIEKALKDLRDSVQAPIEIKIERGNETIKVTVGDPGEMGLSGVPTFVSALPRRPDIAAMTFYCDVQGVLSLVDEGMRWDNEGDDADEVQRIIKLVGVDKIEHVAGRSGFDGKRFLHAYRLVAPGFVNTPLAASFKRTLTAEDIALAPASSSWARWTRFDLGKALEAIHPIVGQIEPGGANPLDQMYEEFRREVGIDLKQDVIDPSGDTWLFFTDADAASMLPIAIVNTTDDAAKMQASFNHMMNKLIEEEGDDEVQKRQIAGTDVFSIVTPLPGGLTPTMGVVNNRFVIGATPQMAEVAAKDQGENSVANAEWFKEAVETLGVEPTATVGFMAADLPASARTMLPLYNLLLGQLAAEAGDELPIDLETFLPTLTQLKPHLGPAVSSVTMDESNIDYMLSEPFPGAYLLSPDAVANVDPFSAMVMAGVMLPALGNARTSARHTVTMSNIRQVTIAYHMYTNDHDGESPANLAALAEYIQSPEPLLAPNQMKPENWFELNAEQQMQWALDNSAVRYLKPEWEAEADTVLFYLDPQFAQGGRVAVGFGDGHAESMTIDELHYQLPAALRPPKMQ